MSRNPQTFLPLPDSLGCLQTQAGGANDWHTHPFDELCLVTETPTTIGHAGKPTTAMPGTLYLFRRGERHRYQNSPKQSPQLWVLHYHGDDALDDTLSLTRLEPSRRVLKLTDEQAETFRALHVKISLERASSRPGATAAQSAWLRLLLVAVARWTANEPADLSPRPIDADLQQIWQILHTYTGEPAGLVTELKRRIPNYDSLRHRFKSTVGDSPARLWSRLRMHQAKNLLLESSLSVKEIAARAGYARQHEFARAFRKQFGISPTGWRNGTHPLSPPEARTVHRGEIRFRGG